ncbi:unknown protein [Seminavis robusta]|uniref:Uncharacterized protein n=1 Tax=Seminavis robusta TaxID=568900 RepID=A0A9N8DRL8_9STRA|nr:unknown protein [Seminavis robusta]|eukprot:Sro239_g095790.1 n/a (1217) ;mRNA; f:19530-23180
MAYQDQNDLAIALALSQQTAREERVRRRQPLQQLRLPQQNSQQDAQQNSQQQQQQQPQHQQKKRSSFSRTTRTEAEWRNDLLSIYDQLYKSRSDENKPKMTLRGFCVEIDRFSQYKRLSQVWKELQLEECLSKRVPPTDPMLINKINSRFPCSTDHIEIQDEDSQESETNNRNRSAKNEMRDHTQWKDLIQNIYGFLSSARVSGQKESVHSYCVKVLKAKSAYRRIADIWKELELEIDLTNGVSPLDSNFKEKLEQRFPCTEQPSTRNNSSNDAPRRARDLQPSSSSFFDKVEEALFAELVSGFAKSGFPLEKADLKRYADSYLAAEGIDVHLSNDTIERIYKAAQIKAKTNVNSIDPKRASQADPRTLNAMYHQLDALIKMAHEIDPIAWPEDRYANIPPTRIYNTDEQGPNPTHLRNPVLIPRDMLVGRSRLFQNTREGDNKMAFHYTVANIVRADGAQHQPFESVDGAPAPYIIISDASSATELDTMEKADRDKLLANQREEDTTIKLNPSVLESWYDGYQLGKREELVNPFGFQVRATPSGSMLKRTFYDFLLHFKQQLPHDQGPGGLGVVLFLDWHCSRECPLSLITSLLRFNILLFVLPSKTSIWSQPCDNGKNELTAKDIAQVAHELGILVGGTLTYSEANRIFRRGLERNCTDQNNELRRTGTNGVASSFRKTGLYPMDYNNEGWTMAYHNFNKLNEMIKQQKRDSGERLPEIIWVTKPRAVDQREALTDEDERLIRSFLPTEDFLAGTDGSDDDLPLEVPLLFLAVAIGDYLLGKYTLDDDRDLSSPPIATEDYEAAALKLVTFEAVTSSNHVDTTCTLTPEQVARDKLRTKLSLVIFGHAIVLREKESNRVLNLTKQSAERFCVFDNERTESNNMEIRSVKQILETCVDAADDEQYTLTKKDKRKQQKKDRIARKKLNESMYEEAQEVADSRRLKRNVEAIAKCLHVKRPRFASRLATLLEDEGVQPEELYQEYESVVLDPFTDVISVTRGDVTKPITMTRVGTDVTAVNYTMETILMKVMIQKQAKDPGAIKRRKRGKIGLSTHLGRSGIIAGILIQRNIKEDELKAVRKEEKGVIDELERMKALHVKACTLMQDLPDSFWKVEAVKGWRRMALVKLFEVKLEVGVKPNAEAWSTALKRLSLTKATVETKVEELDRSIRNKERELAPLLAKRREGEDFLNETQEYAQGDDKEDDEYDDESVGEDE